ncbi:MAG TPA: class I SAM-dependent methyltransferase [Candidatus Angelobacter sp.]|nr:class I SAM-dependent methyltransferase [Candidatus Angelobacter sp.]
MHPRTVVSPEVTSTSGTRTNIFSRIMRSYLDPFISPTKQRMLVRKWAHHADRRSFDWEWEKINYNRIAVVNLLLNGFNDPAYLEIGCGPDLVFNSIPAQNKKGVDPYLGGNIRKTSDDFFKENKSRFDVIFIDGMHTYEQVRKDVINSINSLNHGGWIALHDMLPRNWIEHHIPIISQGAWTGDVWKVAFELAQTEGIEFKILKIDHGVGVIKALRKNVKLKDLTAELFDQEFSYYYDNLNRLPIVEWHEAQDWLHSGKSELTTR